MQQYYVSRKISGDTLCVLLLFAIINLANREFLFFGQPYERGDLQFIDLNGV